jgi:nitrogenase-stabilizing/protective protein
MTSPAVQSGVFDQLNKTSSAEDFFTLLGVDFDPKILSVARLHILRRMAQYLAGQDFDGVADDVVTERCKSVLERAYADFVASSPIDQRVFKVLKDAAAPAKKPVNFVRLGTFK